MNTAVVRRGIRGNSAAKTGGPVATMPALSRAKPSVMNAAQHTSGFCSLQPLFRIGCDHQPVKLVPTVALAVALILADHFFFAARYRQAAWAQLKVAGEHINTELARWSPGMFSRL